MELIGPSLVLLVARLEASIRFYETIGFTSETIGGHVHMNRGDVTFILHQARQASDVRPQSSVEGGLYFDAFCYTDEIGLRRLFGSFESSGVEIARGPNWTDGWSEFTIRDVDGYRIAFGAMADND